MCADRRLRRGDRDEAGVSLVELLVAMGVGSVLLIAIGVVFIATTSGVRVIGSRGSSLADARTTMEAMTRTLRVAAIPPTGGQTSAVLTATTNSVSFFTLLDRPGIGSLSTPNPTLVSYSWDGTCVNEAKTPQRTSLSGSVLWDQNTTTTCLARTLTAPVFAYFTDGVTTTPISGSVGGLDLTARQTVKSVQVTLTIRDPQNPQVSPVSLLDRVTMSNIAS